MHKSIRARSENQTEMLAPSLNASWTYNTHMIDYNTLITRVESNIVYHINTITIIITIIIIIITIIQVINDLL